MTLPNINGVPNMKPELQRTGINVCNDLTKFAQLPDKSRKMAFPDEQELKTAGQEIADLYKMLQHKGRQGAPRLSGFHL